MSKNNVIGEKIRSLRKSKGLTQQQLAEKIGIDFKHLSKIELGKHLPTYHVLKKLAEILEFDIYSIEEQPISKEEITDKITFKSIQILYSARTDEEKQYYLEALKHAQKGLNINIKRSNN